MPRLKLDAANTPSLKVCPMDEEQGDIKEASICRRHSTFPACPSMGDDTDGPVNIKLRKPSLVSSLL